MNILELHDLKKYFATQKAVDGISMNVGKGDIFGLLGPNGAGKTTLLRMITGIFYPDSGEITFNGQRFDALKHPEEIGYMPEERGLYRKMNIGDQVLYLARLKGMRKDEAMDQVKLWFRKFEMESWWNKKVEDLSKGMSQKLQFVTTVMHRPKLIILDEPFSGLDPVNANLIKDEIFDLARKGATIIFSTHRMEQVEEICNHIVLVNKGKKILDGSVNQVKQDFKENLFSVSVERPVLSTISDQFTVVKQDGNNYLLKLSPASTTDAVLTWFINNGAGVKGFTEVMPSLNEIFIRLVENTSTARQFQKVSDKI